jgi:uncharacterized protein YjbI with pentapeptide repeats
MSSVKPRINHATVVAYLALFVALGGTAYAAATITGADVVNGSLTGADLRNGSVRSADVKGITGADLGRGAPWTLRSPNGRFSLAVDNDGVTMQGPGSSVAVDNAGVVIEGSGRTEIRSSGQVRLQGTSVQLDGSTVQLNGLITLNGSCAPVANATAVSQHFHIAPGGGGATSPYQGPSPAFGNVFAC